MIVIQSIGVFLCIILAVGFGLAILPAIRSDAHLLHHPNSNCPECEES